jgi:DNA polymerase
VQAMAMSLPASLEMGAAALGITMQKDMQGSRLAIQMSKPRRMEGARPIWWDDEERLNKLYAYCKQDVRVEQEADRRLVRLRPSERQLWILDQRINDRGVRVDVDLCRQASKIVEAATLKLDKEMSRVTQGEVTGCSQVQKLMIWLRSRGVSTDSVDKEHMTELLGLDLPDDVERALLLRQEAAKASTAKIEALLNCINRDGRARGLLQFHAASTGRWGGRRFQPQNLPRPEMKDPESAIPALMSGDLALVEMLYDRPLSAVSDCLRSMIVAGAGKKMVAADFAAIEARVLAWLAGQDYLVKLFFEDGPIYETMAQEIYKKPINKKQHPNERQVGKTAVLGCGFGMGAPKFKQTCKKVGIAVDDDLAKQTVDAYRTKNDRIKAFWYEAEDAAIDAVRSPGKVTLCAGGKVKWRMAGSFLWCQLPSGRCLCYPYPRIVEKETPWGQMKDALVYKGVDSYTRKWGDIDTYGGSLVENITQAVARDLLAEAMLRTDAKYPLVLTVHDELLAETPDPDLHEYENMMAAVPGWAVGCPVKAEGWVSERYRK